MRNNVGFPDKNSNMGGVDTAFNTWDLSITETGSDFESTSDAGRTGPREALASAFAARSRDRRTARRKDDRA
ncbi:hypothetical protein [Sorangium sp. So ce1389]|uniref:hypothetical protein n=1 Tax=Sorangium sp. So ce1389 TaxID=3133336 RepID=UPI003F61EA27